MSKIVLVDTTIFLNILDIPNRNQQRAAVLEQLEQRYVNNDSMLLPLATVWETGNHISKLSTGGLRRKFGEKFLRQVSQAFEGTAPYTPTNFHDRKEFLSILHDFPEHVTRSKNDQKPNEGGSLSDLSIIKEWEATSRKHPRRAVVIWSLDQDLEAYSEHP
jgi:hypothetical protein